MLTDAELRKLFQAAKLSVPSPYEPGTPEGNQDVNLWIEHHMTAEMAGLRAVADAVQAEQRERDAKIAESYALSSDEARRLIRDVAFEVSYTGGYDRAVSDIAVAIRKNDDRD